MIGRQGMYGRRRHLAAMAAIALVAACSGPAADADASSRGQDKPETTEEQMRIRITAADQTFTAALEDSEAARDFAALLPIEVTLSDYNRTEKVADLPRHLSTAGAPDGVDPTVGDIAYFAPWAISMACVLAAGGFPEEAPPLLAKALRHAVAARLRAAGEAAADPSTANAEQARDLLKQDGLSLEAERVLAVLRPGAATPNPADAAELAHSTARLVAALAVVQAPEPAVALAALTG